MNARYRLIFRGIRGGMYYSVDKKTGRRASLHTTSEQEAGEIIEAKNAAERQPVLNLQIAKAYLAGADSALTTRTWQQAMETLIESKQGANRQRWLRVAKDRALAPLLPRTIFDTPGELLLKTLQSGTVSTNVYLRRLHNFCLDMNWLAWPLVPKRQWPAVRFKAKRAITKEEHEAIITAEMNPERRAFYEFCWLLGGAQSDLANLTAEDIDWHGKVVSFHRQKTGTASIIRFGKELEAVLRTLPQAGPLFPKLLPMREGHRATEFARACRRLTIKGITLHSYRYAWAERAKICGYPERFAQEALGHQSKAVHRAYARKAQVVIPTLEDYERKFAAAEGVIVPMPAAVA
jgi:integrase